MTDKQLTRFTNRWAVMLLITTAIAGIFFLYDSVLVKNMGLIQFSTTLGDFQRAVFQQLEHIRLNTYWDFLFIVSYSIQFYLAYRVFQSSMRIPVSKFWVLLCFVPGLFDIIENTLLLILITDADKKLLFNFFWFVVRIKWTLIIPFILINATIFMYYGLRVFNAVTKTFIK